jgi:cell division protein FtsI/penicillin-binding protein 2
MSPTRLLIVAFWVFIVGMLIRQAYVYEANLEKERASKPQHFFFNTPTDTKPAVDPNLQVADVQQTAYSITSNPLAKNFTCHITLTNKGNAKAVNVEIFIRPFRGSFSGGSERDRVSVPISDNDPRAQLGQSIEGPDLAPGQSCTVTATFMSQPGVNPNPNSHPQITFETQKSNP